ncbi:MAG: Ig domain-containing protein [Agathobacter sp.]|nr:Ig domain-containing protein [Agathobacter sp.]
MKEKRQILCFRRVLALFLSLVVVFASLNFSTVDVYAAKTVKAKSITLNKKQYVLKKGKTVKLKATVKPAKSTQKKLVWSSSNKKVATVNSKGVVKGIKNGTSTITVKVKGTKLKATCKIKVQTPVSKISVPKSTVKLIVGEKYKISPTVSPKTASNKKVSYSTSKKSVATVSSKGVITAKKAGTAYITVKAKDGSKKSAKIKVVVKKAAPVDVKVTKVTVNVTKNILVVGENVSATVKVEPTNATNKAVTWSSSNKEVAIVDSNGKITAVSEGTTYITATAKDGSGKSGKVLVTVKSNIIPVDSVTITPATSELEVGETEQLLATIAPANATNKAVTWSSSNSNVVSVDKNGLITAVSAGTATITASVDGGKKIATAVITVNCILSDVQCDGEYFVITGTAVGNDKKEVTIYQISGTKEELDGSEIFEVGVTLADKTLTKVEDMEWNYELTVTYNGNQQTIYIDYVGGISMLPQNAEYIGNQGVSIELVTIEGIQKIRLAGMIEEQFDYSAITFSSNSSIMRYEVVSENGMHYLVIYMDNVEKVRYPVYYEKDVEIMSVDNSVVKILGNELYAAVGTDVEEILGSLTVTGRVQLQADGAETVNVISHEGTTLRKYEIQWKERPELAKVKYACVDTNLGFKYAVYGAKEGTSFDMILSNKKITDFEAVGNDQIHTVVYHQKDIYDEKFVQTQKTYSYVYIRLSNTDEEFASEWVLGEYQTLDNEFDIDDIP